MALRAGEPASTRPGPREEPPLVNGVRPFLVERFFAKHEFTADYMLGSSDADAWSVAELLQLARSRGDTDAEREWAEVGLGYTESAGHPTLRAAAAALYGGPIGAEQVLCAVPVEGIFLAMSSLLAHGDVVVAMMPAYQCLYEVARSKGCTVVPWRASYEPGVGWSFSLADLRSALVDDEGAPREVRMVVTNFPHNPTSWMPSNAEHVELVEICRERGAVLFSDEMYWGMALESGERPVSSCVRYERAVTLSGLSKPHGLPGLRVGWLATQDVQAMSRLQQCKDYVTICGSAPSEALAIIALRHGEALLARAWETTRANRPHLRAFCEEFSGLFEWTPEPSRGLVALVVLRGWAASMGAQSFADWSATTASCVLVPSDCFEAPSPPAVRFGLGRRNFPEALARLGQHLRAQGAQGPAAP